MSKKTDPVKMAQKKRAYKTARDAWTQANTIPHDFHIFEWKLYMQKLRDSLHNGHVKAWQLHVQRMSNEYEYEKLSQAYSRGSRLRSRMLLASVAGVIFGTS